MGLQQLSSSQANPEVPINENGESLFVAAIGGKRQPVTTGLTWGYYGGWVVVNGTPTQIADGTVSLTDNTTNYVEVDQAGAVSVATARSAGKAPLHKIVTAGGLVTSVIDERDPRSLARIGYGIATQAMADANQTLTQDKALCESITTTGALTAQRNLVVPLVRRRWVVRNSCTGFGVQAIGATGTGIVVAAGKVAIVECDGTNVLRVTADV